jgi:alkylhydroperoxidase family enzyme
MNFHKMMAHNPRTLKEWIGFGNHILFENLLEPREREIAILRVAATVTCQYEWGAHRRYTLAQGWMSAMEIDRLAFEARASDWSEHEGALIAAVDGLQSADGTIGDESWSVLATRFGPSHFIDLIYLVGEFRMVATFMKSFRVPLEDNFEPIPTR